MKNKNIITAGAALCVTTSANAQYLDAINQYNPIGTDGVSYSWTDPTLGLITASWSGTAIGTSNVYNSDTRGDGSFVLRNTPNAINSNLNNSSDIRLTFSWANPVSAFDLSVGDFDGGHANPDILTFGGVANLNIVGIGADAQTGQHSYVAPPGGNTLEYSYATGPVSSAIGNDLLGNQVRVSLDDGGAAFNSFTVGFTQGTDLLYIGGTNGVPEPSSALLLSLAGLAGITRRRR